MNWRSLDCLPAEYSSLFHGWNNSYGVVVCQVRFRNRIFRLIESHGIPQWVPAKPALWKPFPMPPESSENPARAQV